MEDNHKNNQSNEKKAWSTPDLEIIDIESGTAFGGLEGNPTPYKVNKYEVYS